MGVINVKIIVDKMNASKENLLKYKLDIVDRYDVIEWDANHYLIGRSELYDLMVSIFTIIISGFISLSILLIGDVVLFIGVTKNNLFVIFKDFATGNLTTITILIYLIGILFFSMIASSVSLLCTGGMIISKDAYYKDKMTFL